MSWDLIGNTELNDLRTIICGKISTVSVERISVCNVSEKLAEHGILCLPCSKTSDIHLLPYQLRAHVNVKVMSSRQHSAKVPVTKHLSW